MLDLAPLFSFPIILILLGLGLYLAFHKRKLPPGVSPTAWIESLNLPEHAKNVRRKEATKNTAKLFTLDWLKEYWQGERTALSAFICWKIGVPILFLVGVSLASVVFGLLLPNKESITNLSLLINGFIILVFVYRILSNVIWWKCAKNSTTFWKYAVRFLAAVGIISSCSVFAFLNS